MTPDELEAIEARASAATPGPWKIDEMEMYIHGGDGFMVMSRCPLNDQWQVRGHGAEVSGKRPRGSQDANAEFIVHARADVPALVAEVKRLRVQNSKLVKAAASAVLLLHKLDHIGDALEEDGLSELDAFDNVAGILSQSDARELLREALGPLGADPT